MTQGVLGCAIPTKKGEIFVQIVTPGPIGERKVLASVVGPTKEDALRAAISAAGITELFVVPSAPQTGLLAALSRCASAIEGLIGCLRTN